MTVNENLLPELIRNDIADIIKSFTGSQFSDNIMKIILFGSFATNKYQPDSDLDVAVVLREPLQKHQRAEYCMLTDNIRRGTDLLFCSEEQLASGKYVFAEILREGLVVYENI